jgi:hypothetical protein
VFAGNLSVLVNGSPTNEINIQRGLKQGDPLASFLFLLVAEGFAGLMRSAVEKNLFKGFSVGLSGLVISHLQYVDNTLCIGKATLENLWTLKAILRGLELAWEPMVECLRKRLRGWKNRYVNLGGRIVIINSVLNSIPIFYLSFLKILVVVLKKII